MSGSSPAPASPSSASTSGVPESPRSSASDGEEDGLMLTLEPDVKSVAVRGPVGKKGSAAVLVRDQLVLQPATLSAPMNSAFVSIRELACP